MNTTRRFYIWLPPLLWMGLIYFFSTSTFSEESTASFLLPVLRALFPEASDVTLSKIHSFVRKMGHFTEFAILSLLWLRTLKRNWGGNPYPFFLISFILSFIYAILDEFHQSFVSVRTPSFIDISIDSSGAAISLLFLKLFKKSRTVNTIKRKNKFL